MSIKMMSMVWEKDLMHNEQLVLLALADHAKDDGTKVFPSIAHVAWKVGYSERQVQRIMSDLRKKEALILVHENKNGRSTNEYEINLSVFSDKLPFGGDKMSGVTQLRHPWGDTTTSPEPSVEPPSKKDISKAISKEDVGVHWDNLMLSNPYADYLNEFASILAEENATGKVAKGRLWREIGKRWLQVHASNDLSKEAWEYGFEQAIARGAANVGYVLKAAKNYRPESSGSFTYKKSEPEPEPEPIGPWVPELTHEEYRAHTIFQLQSRGRRLLAPRDLMDMEYYQIEVSDIWPGEEDTVEYYGDLK
jgi:hypothetical protein